MSQQSKIQTREPENYQFHKPESVLSLIPENSRLLLITDKDGTLDIAYQTEEIHHTPKHTIEALISVSALPMHHVAVISGRALDDLKALTGNVREFWYYGNHGLEVHLPGSSVGSITVPPDYIEKLDLCEVLLTKAISQSRIFSEHIKIVRDFYKLGSWWSPGSDIRDDFLKLLSQVMHESGVNELTETMDGMFCRELLPKGACKGIAVQSLIDLIKPDFILCAGNDLPDLRMYEVTSSSGIPHVNIIVGQDIDFIGAHRFKSPVCLTELFISLSSRVYAGA